MGIYPLANSILFVSFALEVFVKMPVREQGEVGKVVMLKRRIGVDGNNRGSRKVSSSMDEEGFPFGDKLVLRGVIFHGFHGVKPEEKKLGQKFLIDIDAWLDLYKAGESDNLNDTVSYGDIYRITRDIVEGPSQDLLESVAHLIAVTTFEKFPMISAIRVKVGKPHVAVPGSIDYLGVEIFRRNKKFLST